MLSLESPIRPFQSGTCSGLTPKYSLTPLGSNNIVSDMPFLVNSIFVSSPTSCSASRSPVKSNASIPRSFAWREMVPRTSSASQRGRITTPMPIAESSSWISGNCGRSSSGMGERPALYASYPSWRKVGVWSSKATAQYCGRCSRKTRSSMLKKPCTALVYTPSASMSGSAWKARYIRLCPSTITQRSCIFITSGVL